MKKEVQVWLASYEGTEPALAFSKCNKTEWFSNSTHVKAVLVPDSNHVGPWVDESGGAWLVGIIGDEKLTRNKRATFGWFKWQDVPGYGSERCEIMGVTHWMPLPEGPTHGE